MALVSEIITEARSVFLNDFNASRYSDARMLPCVQRAYKDLQLSLIRNGLKPVLEVSPAISIPANTTVLSAVPVDLLVPIDVEERGVGETGWDPMDEREFEPDLDRTETLRFWVWREDGIQFLGSTAAREVRVHYYKSLSAITSVNSIITVLNSEAFLASRSSAYAAAFVGENPSRAEQLLAISEKDLRDVVGINIGVSQSTPVKRRLSRRAR